MNWCVEKNFLYLQINLIDMDVKALMNNYFQGSQSVSVEVFDEKNIYLVYDDLVKILLNCSSIETTVLQAFGYCFYEILDNVLIHSGKQCGVVCLDYLPSSDKIQILVADDGMGIAQSLRSNTTYSNIGEREALMRCIEDCVTDGKGMGFGLYSTSRLVKMAGVCLKIHSGEWLLTYDGNDVRIENVNAWKGVIVYFELISNKEINPNDVVENRTDIEEQFNDQFISGNQFENLW